jgi:hypothetical protein
VLYNKRRGPAYANIKYSRFPDIDSDLRLQSKLGILSSQFHRYRRMITNLPNFVAETALLFVLEGRGGWRKRLVAA